MKLDRIWALPLACALALSARADAPRFDVLEFRVEGNTVLTAQAIEAAVYAHMGEARTLADVEAARVALERAYHDGGYLTVFVDVPEQQVDGGVVRLRVVEGQVERLRVSGARFHSPGVIKAEVAELAEGQVPYFPEVQQQLAGLAAADRRVTPVLRAGRAPGKVEVELKVDDRLPLHGGVEINDRYSANTTRHRLNAHLRYDNLWQRRHSLTLSAQVAPREPDESASLSATYVAPLRGGDHLAAYAAHTRSDVTTLGDANIVGRGNLYGLRYILALPPRPGYHQTLTLGMDYKDFRERTALAAGQFDTPIAYLPFSIAYEGNARAAGRETRYAASLNFALRGLGNDDIECLPGVVMDEFACKRYQAKPNYAYLRLELRESLTWGSGWGLGTRLAAQVASGPLVPSEQFSAGGADSVRGYLESTANGDHGLLTGAELRAPSLAPRLTPALKELTPYLFLEAATLRRREPLPGEAARHDLLAAGLGVRFAGPGGLNGALDYAHPLRDAGQVREGDGRAHFRLGYQW